MPLILAVLLLLGFMAVPAKTVMAQSASPTISISPSISPSPSPSISPSQIPTATETSALSPSPEPSITASLTPTASPTMPTSLTPTMTEEIKPTNPSPTARPTLKATEPPKKEEEAKPTLKPSPSVNPSNTPTPGQNPIIPLGPPTSGGLSEVVGKVGTAVLKAPLEFINDRVALEVYRTESLSRQTVNQLTALAVVLLSIGLSLIRPAIIDKAGLKIDEIIQNGSKATLFKTISRLL